MLVVLGFAIIVYPPVVNGKKNVASTKTTTTTTQTAPAKNTTSSSGWTKDSDTAYTKELTVYSDKTVVYGKEEDSTTIDLNALRAEIEKAQKQTTEASILLYRKGSIPISEIENISTHIKKLNSNLFLSIKQLLDLKKILNISSNLKDYFLSTEIDMTEFVNLNNLFNNLYVNPSIEKELDKAIIDENTLSDDASHELKNIRKSIRSKEQEIRAKLNSFLNSKYVQESIITVRNGRFVVPIKNEHRQDVKGFIHDISSSGSTVFIEPISIFDLNNDLKGKNVLILVGPEGGFDKSEVELLEKAGFKSLVFGNRILRTETAPLYIMSVLSFLMGENNEN